MRLAGLLCLFVLFAFSASPATSVLSPVLEILIESIGQQAPATLGPSPSVETAAKLVPDPKRPAVLAALKDLEGQSSSTTTLREIMDASLILGQASQALSSADKLREIAPGPESETTRAWALSQTGDFPGAFAAAQELDKLYPGREDVRALLAYTRERVKAGGGGGPSAFMSKELDINDGTVLAGPGRDPSEVRPVAMALMKRAVAVRREGDPEGTLTLAREALRADPTAPVVQEFYRMAVADHAKWRWENPRVLEDYAKATQAKQEGRWEAAIAHMEAAASKQPHPNVLKALEKLKADAEAAKNKATPMGASNFAEGLLHYMGKSGRPRRVDFEELDTSGVKVTDFPQVSRALEKRTNNAQIEVENSMAWTARNRQWLLLGRIRLLLRGRLTLSSNCTWAFSGRLSSYDDRYDFDRSNRDWLGEGLTAIGRSLPGRSYIITIQGSKPIRASGHREACP